MPKVTVRLTDLSPKLSDGSDNQLYSLFWLAALQPALKTTDGRQITSPTQGFRNWSVEVVNGQRATINNVAQDELPAIARLAAIHALTGGDYTVDGLRFMVGVNDARWDKDIVIQDTASPPQAILLANLTPAVKRLITRGGADSATVWKWNQLVAPGRNYTSERFDVSGTFRNWISTDALDPNGITIEQYAALTNAQGVIVRTFGQFNTIRPAIEPLTP